MSRIIEGEVAATMVDREPDFEDEKIRRWTIAPEGQDSAGDVDETILSVDLDEEEIYESRAYRLRPHPRAILEVAQRRPDAAEMIGDEQALLEHVANVLEGTMLKVLTKRNRTDGRISYMVTAVGLDVHILVEAGEFTNDAQYREFVTELETDLLAPGFVSEPLVIPLEQWRRYEHEGQR